MANIALRNPQFKYMYVGTGVLSLVCVVTIDGTVRYTLTKNLPVGATGQFDISELARDYLDISYLSSYIPQKVTINTVITSYDGLNGLGTVVGSVTFDDIGFEAYGTFTEGANPEVPFGATLPTFLMADNNSTSSSAPFTIFVPTLESGLIPYMDDVSTLGAVSYNSGDSVIHTPIGAFANITRIDCTKYGDGTKIIFINKYGVQQDLWFFLRKDKSLVRKNEGYKANTIEYKSSLPATYTIQNAPNKVFNTQAKQSHKLSSGYYPEFANQYFEELLLSEYVWMETDNGIIPVKVKTSSMKFKTSVNDRLIEYVIDFEEAFDYINNIR
mgnify:CR=1 FL=1